MKERSGKRYLLKGFALSCPTCRGEFFTAQQVPREGDLLMERDGDEQTALFCCACGHAKSYVQGMVSERGEDVDSPRPPLI